MGARTVPHPGLARGVPVHPTGHRVNRQGRMEKRERPALGVGGQEGGQQPPSLSRVQRLPSAVEGPKLCQTVCWYKSPTR